MHLRCPLPAVASAGFRKSKHQIICLHVRLVPAVTDTSPAYLPTLIGSTGQDGQSTVSLSREVHRYPTAHHFTFPRLVVIWLVLDDRSMVLRTPHVYVDLPSG